MPVPYFSGPHLDPYLGRDDLNGREGWEGKERSYLYKGSEHCHRVGSDEAGMMKAKKGIFEKDQPLLYETLLRRD